MVAFSRVIIAAKAISAAGISRAVISPSPTSSNKAALTLLCKSALRKWSLRTLARGVGIGEFRARRAVVQWAL